VRGPLKVLFASGPKLDELAALGAITICFLAWSKLREAAPLLDEAKLISIEIRVELVRVGRERVGNSQDRRKGRTGETDAPGFWLSAAGTEASSKERSSPHNPHDWTTRVKVSTHKEELKKECP
jgi:hypothetical protein